MIDNERVIEELRKIYNQWRKEERDAWAVEREEMERQIDLLVEERLRLIAAVNEARAALGRAFSIEPAAAETEEQVPTVDKVAARTGQRPLNMLADLLHKQPPPPMRPFFVGSKDR